MRKPISFTKVLDVRMFHQGMFLAQWKLVNGRNVTKMEVNAEAPMILHTKKKRKKKKNKNKTLVLQIPCVHQAV